MSMALPAEAFVNDVTDHARNQAARLEELAARLDALEPLATKQARQLHEARACIAALEARVEELENPL